MFLFLCLRIPEYPANEQFCPTNFLQNAPPMLQPGQHPSPLAGWSPIDASRSELVISRPGLAPSERSQRGRGERSQRGRGERSQRGRGERSRRDRGRNRHQDAVLGGGREGGLQLTVGEGGRAATHGGGREVGRAADHGRRREAAAHGGEREEGSCSSRWGREGELQLTVEGGREAAAHGGGREGGCRSR